LHRDSDKNNRPGARLSGRGDDLKPGREGTCALLRNVSPQVRRKLPHIAQHRSGHQDCLAGVLLFRYRR